MLIHRTAATSAYHLGLQRGYRRAWLEAAIVLGVVVAMHQIAKHLIT